MKIVINNKEMETEAKSLLDLALELSLPEKGVAVAVDSEMAPRSQWEGFKLKEGQKITILKAFSGG